MEWVYSLHGLALIGRDWRNGYIDKTGKIVISPQFTRSYPFSEELGAVKIGDKWGYIDKTGKIAIPPQFSEVSERFVGGLALVSVKGFLYNQYGYIDKTGKFVWSSKNWYL